MKKPEIRDPYNYDSDALSAHTGLTCNDESLTEQEHVKEADINFIADTFMKTGTLPQVIHLPTQGDFEGIFDFQTAMNTIKKAKDEFGALPAKVRARFENDPAKLLDFIQDKDNYDEAIKLGFIPPKLEKEATHGQTTRSTSQTPQKDQTTDTRTTDDQTAPPAAKKP